MVWNKTSKYIKERATAYSIAIKRIFIIQLKGVKSNFPIQTLLKLPSNLKHSSKRKMEENVDNFK